MRVLLSCGSSSRRSIPPPRSRCGLASLARRLPPRFDAEEVLEIPAKVQEVLADELPRLVGLREDLGPLEDGQEVRGDAAAVEGLAVPGLALRLVEHRRQAGAPVPEGGLAAPAQGRVGAGDLLGEAADQA